VDRLSVEYTTNDGGMVTSSMLFFNMASLADTAVYQCGTTVQSIQVDNEISIFVFGTYVENLLSNACTYSILLQ